MESVMRYIERRMDCLTSANVLEISVITFLHQLCTDEYSRLENLYGEEAYVTIDASFKEHSRVMPFSGLVDRDLREYSPVAKKQVPNVMEDKKEKKDKSEKKDKVANALTEPMDQLRLDDERVALKEEEKEELGAVAGEDQMDANVQKMDANVQKMGAKLQRRCSPEPGNSDGIKSSNFQAYGNLPYGRGVVYFMRKSLKKVPPQQKHMYSGYMVDPTENITRIDMDYLTSIC
jgi:hypothetical protein